MHDRERYNKIIDRMNKVEAMLCERDLDGADDSEFPHIEWLIAEKESLMLELEQVQAVMGSDGSIDY